MISSSDIIARSNQHTDSQHLSHLNNYHPQMTSYILWVPSTIITAHSDTLIVQEENSPGVTSLCATNRSNLWNQWTLFCIFYIDPFITAINDPLCSSRYFSGNYWPFSYLISGWNSSNIWQLNIWYGQFSKEVSVWGPLTPGKTYLEKMTPLFPINQD